VNLNEILAEILELIRHQPNYGEMEVVADDLAGTLPGILGDPSGLRQVFMNLLINACHAVKDGGRVEVSTSSLEHEREIYIQVRDTGCGISQENIDRIWDPFFTTKEVGKGVGLGLALTYNIVKRHGGEIKVVSSIGEGATFTVTLPIKGKEEIDSAAFTTEARRHGEIME
jgi:signal transduction histidine kinase